METWKKFQSRLGHLGNLSNVNWEIFPKVYGFSIGISDAFVNRKDEKFFT